MDRIGCRYLMSIIEGAIIALIVLNMLVTVRMLGYVMAQLQETTAQGLQQIDQSLAQAIQATMSQLNLGNFEPVNPIQMAIAEFLKAKVQSTVVDQPRGENGQFIEVTNTENPSN